MRKVRISFDVPAHMFPQIKITAEGNATLTMLGLNCQALVMDATLIKHNDGTLGWEASTHILDDHAIQWLCTFYEKHAVHSQVDDEERTINIGSFNLGRGDITMMNGDVYDGKIHSDKVFLHQCYVPTGRHFEGDDDLQLFTVPVLLRVNPFGFSLVTVDAQHKPMMWF